MARKSALKRVDQFHYHESRGGGKSDRSVTTLSCGVNQITGCIENLLLFNRTSWISGLSTKKLNPSNSLFSCSSIINWSIEMFTAQHRFIFEIFENSRWLSKSFFALVSCALLFPAISADEKNNMNSSCFILKNTVK